MRRFFTLVCLLCLAIPAGISISGCTRNPAANYCNGLGYGTKITDVASIDLEPRTTGISLAFGQTQQVSSPTSKTCQGDPAAVGTYAYGTTNNQLVDISPSGNICAGTWNRNSGGGIGDYTICNKPNPLPTTSGVPYGTAYVTATANSVTSNPVEIYVHAQVTSISLVLNSQAQGQPRCYSQGETATLDAQAFYSNNGATALLCSPGTLSCSSVIGNLNYAVSVNSVASINPETNQITAELPGTTAITASVAGSGSSAGYFSTCPPKSISITLNGKSGTANPVTVNQGAPQNMVTTVTDTRGNTITGLVLDYQSTNAVDISAGNSGTVQPSFPGAASIFAICQPANCNPSPINEVGLFGTGLPVSSNPVAINTPGTASAYLWFAAPGQSQYFIPIDLLTGAVGSTVRLPYVPNSMVMDQLGTNLYFGSSRELMIYSTANNSLSKADTNAPGVVLAVSPNNQTLLVNDQARQLFYIYGTSGSIQAEFGGMGNAAAWTPDSKTLYITDNASLGAGHSDTLYVYNQNTGWTTYPKSPLAPSPLPPGALPPSNATPNTAVAITSQTPALTVPGVGAFVRGNPTNDYTWCPSGTVGDYASMVFYPNPQTDTVPVQSDTLAATPDGQHILGAALTGGGITLSDIGVTIPNSPASQCPFTITGAGANQVQTLSPLSLFPTPPVPAQFPLNRVVNPVAVNQVIPSPASKLAFITYTGGATSGGPSLPYYVPGSGVVSYVPLTGSSVTAPLAGAFSPDDTTFYVSTAGDNMIHYIDVKTLKDTQQIAPNLPACTPGNDPGCLLTAPSTNPVPATVITVKPRTTT